ncbi:hypothetical protein [Aestuariibaculum marinum]|uniref:Uncharacterized protein n=1 Tax=Aestuariibaculum marinum TaxID=2683592 RepID=A0A8J6PYD1_9FLAO|nr:hypothetical protein [Aestuariibaculum marinum]MBD0823275.1 hypothetical protein [Aestuariibaculum marinum]
MKIQNKNILASILFVLLISFVCVAEEKLPPEPSARAVSAMGTPPPGASINGGAAVVFILGLFFGVKKILSQKN